MRVDIRSDQSEEIDEIQYGDDSDQYLELLPSGLEIMDMNTDTVAVGGEDVRNLAKALIKAADLKGW